MVEHEINLENKTHFQIKSNQSIRNHKMESKPKFCITLSLSKIESKCKFNRKNITLYLIILNQESNRNIPKYSIQCNKKRKDLRNK